MSEGRQSAEQSASEDIELEVDEQEPEGDEEADDIAEEDGDGSGDDGSDSEAQESQRADGAAGQPQRRNVERGGGRANQRIQQLARERDEARAREQVFQQQLNQLLQRSSVEDQRATEAAEAERLKYMAPEEQLRYHNDKLRNEMRGELQRTQYQLWDQGDRRELADIYEKNPTYRKFDGRVEELRQQAPTVPRRMLLATAIGLAALDNAGSARTRQEKRAETSQRQQQTRPPGGGSNVASPRQRSGARQGNFEHMRNVTI